MEETETQSASKERLSSCSCGFVDKRGRTNKSAGYSWYQNI